MYMLSIKNSSISISLSSLIFLLQLECLTNMLYQTYLQLGIYMQFLTLYASWMRALSANFKETCGILVYSVEK